MANRTVTDRPKVATLPKKAQSVKEFAEKIGVSTNHVYKMAKFGQLEGKGYKIVIFGNFNFVVPL